MDPKSRRSSSRIATKKSLATVGVESLTTTTTNQDPSVALDPEPSPSPPPQVQRGNKRKAVLVSSPTGSHDKKLRRTIVDTTQSKGAVVDVSEAVAPPAKNELDAEPGSSTERPVVDVSEAVAPPAKNEPDAEPGSSTEIPVVDVSEAVAPPAKNELDAEPGSSTERPITPSCQEDPEKPWVPPVIERRNPLVNRFESLITPENFTLLTDEQKRKLYTLLPGFDREVDDSEPNGNLDSGILPPFWNDTRFRTQLGTIGERLEQGKYSQKFRDQIDSIMRRRADDEFQFMKDRAMESFWGQKKEITNPLLAGQAASIKLTTMARHHMIRVGDVLCLRRQFVGYKLIEKHATITAIDQGSGAMQLTYPPAQMRQSVVGVEDKTMHDAQSPGQIERILLEENGMGPPKPPNGNSFKNITVFRGGNELGTLFLLRAQFFQTYLPPVIGAGPSAESKKAVPLLPKAPESTRLARSTRSKSPLNGTHLSNEHMDKNGSKEGKEEVVEKTIIRSCSPVVGSLRSNPRRLASKIAKSASPVSETHPGDKQTDKKDKKDKKAPEEKKAPVTKKRRATRKR